MLTLLGIATGVAAVVSVELSSNALNRSFQQAASDLDGRATHRIIPQDRGITPAAFASLRRDLGFVPMAPIMERQVLVDSQIWTLLGVDPLSERRFSRAAAYANRPDAGWYSGAGGVVLPDGIEKEHFAFLLGEVRYDAPVAGHFESASQTRIALADLSQMSQWTQTALLDRIDVVADHPEVIERLEQWVRTHDARLEGVSRSGPDLTRAFELNLFALGMLMALVGMLIVYNTLQFQIAKRQQSLATLAAIGASPAQLRRWTQAEILALAALGSAIGLLLGRGMAEFTIVAMEQTVNDLYATVEAHITMTFRATAAGLAVVLAACVPAAWRLGLRAGGLGYQQTTAAPVGLRILSLSVMLMAVGAILLRPESLSLSMALTGMFCIASGYAAAVSPLFGTLLGRCVHWIGVARMPSAALAVRRLPRTFFTTSPAVAALVLAMAAVIGVGTMVTGFKHSVEQWLGKSLSADYYVGSQTVIPTSALQRLQSLETVSATTWFHTDRVSTSRGEIELSLQELTPRARKSVVFLGQVDAPWSRFDRGEVFVSQSFANLASIDVGDSLDVDLPCGRERVAVAAVIEDYRAGGGRVIGSRNALTPGCPLLATSVGLELLPPVDSRTVEQLLGQVLRDYPQLRFTATTDILALSLQVFDRTFAMTNALKWIAGLVALIGLTGALSAIELGRSEELALLGRLGLSRREQRRILLIESGMLGLWCALAAIPLGILLGWLLCTVINPRAFGWTIEFVLQPLPIAQSLAIAVAGSLGAALLAGRGRGS